MACQPEGRDQSWKYRTGTDRDHRRPPEITSEIAFPIHYFRLPLHPTKGKVKGIWQYIFYFVLSITTFEVIFRKQVRLEKTGFPNTREQ